MEHLVQELLPGFPSFTKSSTFPIPIRVKRSLISSVTTPAKKKFAQRRCDSGLRETSAPKARSPAGSPARRCSAPRPRR